MVVKKDPPLTCLFCIFFSPGESKIRGRKMYFFKGRSPRDKIHYLELGDVSWIRMGFTFCQFDESMENHHS